MTVKYETHNYISTHLPYGNGTDTRFILTLQERNQLGIPSRRLLAWIEICLSVWQSVTTQFRVGIQIYIEIDHL